MLKKLLFYGKENNSKTIWSTFILLLSVLFQTAPFIFVYQIIDRVIRNQTITPKLLLLCALGVLLSLIIHALLYAKGLSLSHEAAYGTLMNLRISLQEKLEKLPLGVIEGKGTGTLKKLFVDDIDSLELMLAHGLPEGAANIMGIIVLYLFLFILNWRLALLAIVTLPLGMLAMMLMYSIGTKRMGAYYQAGQVMNNAIIEYVNGMEVVKVFNKSSESYEKLRDSVINYREYTLAWFKACWPLMAVYGALLPCTLLANLPVGSWLVLKGTVALSEYVLVMCLSLGLGIPLLRAVSFMPMFPQVNYKIGELEKLLENPPLKESDEGFHGADYKIAYRNVSFGYGEQEVIHTVSLTAEPGTSTALVGESGSGKSTLARLLLHYYDVNDGAITIGGQSIGDMSLTALNRLVSYVSQDSFLFNMSLMENIRIGRPDATDQEVMEAAAKAQCDFIEKFPNGFATLAGDCGNQLSGGEKQRLTLARAILKDAPIIVLDEVTAFADAESEARIAAVLSEFIKGRTLLIIAHRLSSIVNASQICVLKEGSIVERGTYDELLALGNEYKKLWDAHVKSMEWGVGKEAKA
ncbi:MAG: ABC transporter ATP-binding protein [Stomatobaculum sp.]